MNANTSEHKKSYQLPALPLWSVILLGAVGALLPFIRTLQFDFVWDDSLLLVEWPYYRSPELFGEAIWRHVPFSANYFRPTTALTFLLNNTVHGLQPGGYHAVSVMLHVFTTSLFAWLAFRILQNIQPYTEPNRTTGDQPNVYTWLALSLTLFFAWYPVHVEAIAFVSSRFDLLSTFFVLLALALALFVHPRWIAAILAGSSFLLALGAKEMAITVPLIFFAVSRAFDGESNALRNLRKYKFIYLAFAFAALLYLTTRYISLGYLLQPSENALPAGNALQHILLVALSAMRYLLLLIWPFGTSSVIHFAILPLSTSSIQVWIALVVGIGLLFGLIWAVWKQKRWAWLWVAFLFSLLPVLNIMPLDLRGGSFIAERFLYLPSALFLLAIGASLLSLLERFTTWAFAPPMTYKPLVLAVVLLPIGAFLFFAIQTTAHWRDNDSLWQWAWQTAPQSSLPPTNLAFTALAQNDGTRALQWATQAVRLDPENSTAHNNVGAALMLLGRTDEATDAYQAAVEIRPNNIRYWENLASALLQSGQYERLVRITEDELLSRQPDSGLTYQMLGEVYLQLGQPKSALDALRMAESLLPDPTVLQDSLVVALAASGQGAELLRYLEQAHELPADAWVRSGDMLLQQGDLEHAVRAYERAQSAFSGRLDSSSVLRIQVQRAELLIQMGDLQEAKGIAVEILALHPMEPRGQKLMGDILRIEGSLSAALAAYQRADQLMPNTPAIIFALAEVYAEQGGESEALAYFEKTAELAPNFASVHYRWGEFLWGAGEREAAIPHFLRYLMLAPDGDSASKARIYLEQ